MHLIRNPHHCSRLSHLARRTGVEIHAASDGNNIFYFIFCWYIWKSDWYKVFNRINMFIHSLKRYDIKINCFERTTETGVLNNLCICFKKCVWPLQKNEAIRTNSEVIFRFSTKKYIRISYNQSFNKIFVNQCYCLSISSFSAKLFSKRIF